MKLLILGATGPTGRLIVGHALSAGDAVTVLVRDPAALGADTDGVDVIVGDATSAADVGKAMIGQDAVISALGRGRSTDPEGLFSGAAHAVVSAAQDHGVTRLVWLSSFGVGETYTSASPEQKQSYDTFLRDIYTDKAAAEREIRSSNLEWTIVYPTVLTDDPQSENYRVAESLPMSGIPRVARADVAHFMYGAISAGEWVRRGAVITA